MVFEKLREIFANQFGLDPETITESTDIVSDLGADSTRRLRQRLLLSSIERRGSIRRR